MKALVFTLLAAVWFLGGCAAPAPQDDGSVARLAAEIQKLGPDIDPAEAHLVARLSHEYSLELKRQYNVTDPPIIHNAKVINGFRERGLCNDWTEDLLKRLRQEDLKTLSLHWATSPPTPFRIIHHTTVVSRKGETLYDGIVLDPWRASGNLFWDNTRDDTRYNWRPRLEVRDELLRGQ